MVLLAMPIDKSLMARIRDMDAATFRLLTLTFRQPLVERLIIATQPRTAVRLFGAAIVVGIRLIKPTPLARHPLIPFGASSFLIVRRT